MKDSIDSIFDMSLKDLEDSDFRFFINRSRSVVIMNGSEFDDKIIPADTDIYILYNDPDRHPLLISFSTLVDREIGYYTHKNYIISYVSKDRKCITYLRKDAFDVLDKQDIIAAEEFNAKTY